MRVTIRRLFAVAAFAVVPVLAQAAAPHAAPAPATAKTETPMSAARKALDEVSDMHYQARALQDVINDLKEKIKVPIILDNVIYQFGLDPTQPTVNVNLKQVKMRDGLKAVLAPYNLKFGLTAEGLFISTEDGVISRQLRQRVSVDCDGTSFGMAAKQLAADTGANVVVDPRLGDKANKSVTLKLDDVPLETAIRLLAEVADLRAVRMSNVLFVTTPEKADKLRPDADGPTAPSPINPVFPGVIQNGWGVPGVAFPVPVNPPPAACPVPPPAPANPPPANPPAGGGPAPAAPPAAPANPPAAGGAPPAAPATPPATPPAPPAEKPAEKKG